MKIAASSSLWVIISILYCLTTLTIQDAFCATIADQQLIQEQIVGIDKLEQDPQLILYKKIMAMISYQNTKYNLNPLATVNKLTPSDSIYQDYSSLHLKPAEVTTAYIGKRVITTQIPIGVFKNTAFSNPKIQNKLFSDVNFFSCESDHCRAEQETVLGKAKYEVIYRFLDSSILSSLAIPLELLPDQDLNKIKFSLIQYAFNWSDFFSSGLNISLINEDQNHNAQIVTFQIFLLTPHFLSDSLYKSNISRTIDSQTKNFIDYISRLKSTSSEISNPELQPLKLENFNEN